MIGPFASLGIGSILIGFIGDISSLVLLFSVAIYFNYKYKIKLLESQSFVGESSSLKKPSVFSSVLYAIIIWVILAIPFQIIKNLIPEIIIEINEQNVEKKAVLSMAMSEAEIFWLDNSGFHDVVDGLPEINCKLT